MKIHPTLVPIKFLDDIHEMQLMATHGRLFVIVIFLKKKRKRSLDSFIGRNAEIYGFIKAKM